MLFIYYFIYLIMCWVFFSLPKGYGPKIVLHGPICLLNEHEIIHFANEEDIHMNPIENLWGEWLQHA